LRLVISPALILPLGSIQSHRSYVMVDPTETTSSQLGAFESCGIRYIWGSGPIEHGEWWVCLEYRSAIVVTRVTSGHLPAKPVATVTFSLVIKNASRPRHADAGSRPRTDQKEWQARVPFEIRLSFPSEDAYLLEFAGTREATLMTCTRWALLTRCESVLQVRRSSDEALGSS
jgi:hypothetical protein